jgi:competence protein ComEA
MKNFFVGMGIGWFLALIFAPASGSDTREAVSKAASEFRGRRNDRSKAASTDLGENEQSSSSPQESEQLLNSVSRDELLRVHGVGPVLADRIIAGRPYRSERELVDRGILPETVFALLREEVLKNRKVGS